MWAPTLGRYFTEQLGATWTPASLEAIEQMAVVVRALTEFSSRRLLAPTNVETR